MAHCYLGPWSGIVGSQALSVCHDCLCLMAFFRVVMSLVHNWAEWCVWTGTDAGYCQTITWEGGYLPRLRPPCDVDRLCDYRTWQIKGPVVIIMLDRDADNSPQRCACMCGTSLGVLSAGRILLMAIGWIDCGGGPVDCSDWTRVHSVVDFSHRGVRIGYIRGELWDRSSTDAAPVTGSLVFYALFGCLDVYCAAGFTLCRTFCSTDCVLLAGLFTCRVSGYWTMATEAAALVENRAGITFGVELYVPWDAPEAVVDIRSEGVVPLRSIPDVIGLAGRRADAVECRIIQGRDIRSVRVLRLGTIVAVSSVMVHSVERHAPGLYGSCSGAHDVPWDVKSASLEQFLPPWKVRRQVWSDSLKPQHSGISTDILLFSDINLSLVHHYQIHKCGLPHVAFRRNYMSQLRALLPLPVAQPVDGVLSPALTGPGSLRPASSTELVGKSPRKTRRAKRWMWPVCVVETSVGDLPVLMLQDPSDVQGRWSSTVGLRCSWCLWI